MHLRNRPYIFGYKNGLPPDIETQIWARQAVDQLLSGILSPDQMRMRENKLLFQEAISQVAEEIVDRYFQTI